MTRSVIAVVAGMVCYGGILGILFLLLLPDVENGQVPTGWGWSLMALLLMALACFSAGVVVRLVTPKGGLAVLVGLLTLPYVLGFAMGGVQGPFSWREVLEVFDPCVLYYVRCRLCRRLYSAEKAAIRAGRRPPQVRGATCIRV